MFRRMRIVWGLALGAMMAAAAMAYAVQLRTGLGATALREPVTWGFYVVGFAYCAGMGVGALAVAAFALARDPVRHRDLGADAAAIALVALAAAGLFITLDVGRVDRIWMLAARPNWRSPLAWDFILLNLLLLAAAALLFLNWREMAAASPRLPSAVRRLLRLNLGHSTGPGNAMIRWFALGLVVVVPAAYLLMARVFTTLQARPTWNESGLPVVLLVSAIVSGLAAVALSCHLRSGAADASVLNPILGGAICLDLLITLAPAVALLQFDSPPRLANTFPDRLVATEVVFGLALPLLLLTVGRTKPQAAVPAYVLVLVGTFLKRWHIIVSAMERRSLPLPDGAYFPNQLELIIGSGVVAFILLALGVLGSIRSAYLSPETGKSCW